MKTNLFLFAALAAAFLSVAPFMAAQVTIGGSDLPKAGTILDLNPQNGVKGGLALSNVYLDKLTYIPTGTNLFPDIIAGTNDDVNPDFTGAIVWNTNDGLVPNGDGLYLWDGNKWNYIGGSDGFFSIPAPTCTNPLPNLIFASYNLGADVAKLNTLYPDLSPAKQQMKFLALEPYVALDVTVFGDWYQWGRVADGHEKPNSTTYAGPTSDVDANGQATDTGGKGQFIKGSTSYYDWRATHQHNLWGNGEGVSSQGSDNQGGVLSSSDGNYYQNTDWAIPDNNPCPSGWRVPTQDEWERLINYGCGTPQTAGGDITVSSTGTATTTRGGNELTWVPVKGGKVTSSGWAATTGNLGGYAVYKKADWDKAIANGGYFNPSGSGADYAKLLYNAAAPEPLLFFSIPGWRKSNTGVVYSVSVSANYWGSTTSDAYACNFALYNPNVFIDFIDRSYAFSVRCVKN